MPEGRSRSMRAKRSGEHWRRRAQRHPKWRGRRGSDPLRPHPVRLRNRRRSSVDWAVRSVT